MLIPLLAGNNSFQEQHERRCGALYASMMQSDNIFIMLVHYMARRAMHNVLGTLGMNMVILYDTSWRAPRKRCIQLSVHGL